MKRAVSLFAYVKTHRELQHCLDMRDTRRAANEQGIISLANHVLVGVPRRVAEQRRDDQQAAEKRRKP